MTTKTKWRLSKLPTPDELALLVDKGIVKKEEAREILISQETEEDRNTESLKAEIKFLKELVEKLSNRQTIVETIREVYVPYKRQPWYGPYEIWCTAGTNGNIQYLSTTGSAGSGTGASGASLNASGGFSNIQTF